MFASVCVPAVTVCVALSSVPLHLPCWVTRLILGLWWKEFKPPHTVPLEQHMDVMGQLEAGCGAAEPAE